MENKNPLPKEITAPSGMTYQLAWSGQEQDYSKKLDVDTIKEGDYNDFAFAILLHEKGIILDENATDEQRNTLSPIYVRPIIKDDGHLGVAATRFRIRKLTNRECYRLMDVPEDAIDKLLTTQDVVNKKTGETEQKLVVSKSQHYKCAGNSIVVNCLTQILDKLIFPPADEKPVPVYEQMTLDFEF